MMTFYWRNSVTLITMTTDEYVDVDQITETEEALSDDAIVDMVSPNTSDPSVQK